MLYGLTGASRAGKTTLAKQLAQDLCIDFHPTSVGEVSRSLGFDPVAPMDLNRRVMLQIQLLDHHVEMLEKLPRPLIVDRTPLDYAAYTLCEFYMTSSKDAYPEAIAAATKLVDKALNATARLFDGLYYLAPLPTYEEAEGKPDANPAFHLHYAMVIKGLLMTLNGKINYVMMENDDFDFRSEFIHDHIVGRINGIEAMRKSAPFH